jgi:hypothetical protein
MNHRVFFGVLGISAILCVGSAVAFTLLPREDNRSSGLVTEKTDNENPACNISQMFTPPSDEVDWSSVKFYLATSQDGVTFSDGELFLTGGGVPSVTVGADGTVVTVFNWFPEYEEDPVCYNKVGVMISEDDGKTWTEPQGVFFEDFPDDWQLPFDPTITTAEDGYRMFFTTHELGMNESFVYGSAVSTDGIHYTYEPGIRFSSDVANIVDGAEVRVGDAWYMVAPMAKKDGVALDAWSVDGVTFTERTSDRGDGIYWVGNMVSVEGAVRFYGSCINGSANGSLCYSSTEDGLVWSKPVATNMPGADPGITYTDTGKYLLIYSEPKAGMPMPEDSESDKR